MPPRNTLQQTFQIHSTHLLDSGARFEVLQDTLLRVLLSTEGISVDHRHRGLEPASAKDELFNNSEGTSSLILATAVKNTWSRSARRRRKAEMDTDQPVSGQSSSDVAEPQRAMVCSVLWVNDDNGAGGAKSGGGDDESWRLVFDWVCGKDRALFEGFVSHVSRKVGDAVK